METSEEFSETSINPFMDAHTYPAEEQIIHKSFMREAIAMAELALRTDETPVACVLVHNNAVIGRGMNATNRTLNGTRHAEFMAIASLMNPLCCQWPPKPHPTSTICHAFTDTSTSPPSTIPAPASVPPKQYNTDILKECDLYVTVEPCIMCASLLRQYGIRKVYFGASNDRFGGTGGVLRVHDGPGPERGYPVSGGWLREEAILLLRRFYVQQNEKAPEPRNKKDRVLKLEVEPLMKPPGPPTS